MPGASANASPAVLTWDTRTVADGMHSLVVRATDSQGGTGDSLPVSVAVSNQSGCGCSARGGGWESLGLLALAAAIRRRRS
jgi:MYXO-CTERM domain-containing protein